MKTTPRWIAAMQKEAATLQAAMPWERGARRESMIAARKDAVARARARVDAIQTRTATRLSA